MDNLLHNLRYKNLGICIESTQICLETRSQASETPDSEMVQALSVISFP